MRLLLSCTLLACLSLTLRGSAASVTGPTTQISIDTSDAPAMHDYAGRVQQVVDEWYPKLVAELPSEGFVAPTKITIIFRRDYDGVAATSGDRVVASVDYFTKHPNDLGAFVHELVHVVQHYTHGDRPGWLVEGIADDLRWFHYEPASRRPHPDRRRAKFDDSYQTSAAFLDWAQRTYNKDLVMELNAACREGRYRESIWQELTGHSLQQLDAEWHKTLAE